MRDITLNFTIKYKIMNRAQFLTLKVKNFNFKVQNPKYNCNKYR